MPSTINKTKLKETKNDDIIAITDCLEYCFLCICMVLILSFFV